MNQGLWIAKTGLDAQQTRMAVVSNNLANVNTTGFKQGRAVFEDLLYQNVRQSGGQTSQDTELPSGMHLGTGVRIVATEKMFTQGSVLQTENALDVAINGRGFFQVEQPDGTLAYSRDGTFQLNDQGDSSSIAVSSGGFPSPIEADKGVRIAADFLPFFKSRGDLPANTERHCNWDSVPAAKVATDSWSASSTSGSNRRMNHHRSVPKLPRPLKR